MEIETKSPRVPMEWAETLTTRDGVVMAVRPVVATDAPLLEALFDRVSPADLRARFLCGMRRVDRARIADMVDVDYVHKITFLALDPSGAAIATAMLAAGDSLIDAEVAISVRSDMKGRGIGWTLLDHVMKYARDRGFASVSSVESRQSSETIAVERDAGFRFHASEGDGADVVATKSLAATGA